MSKSNIKNIKKKHLVWLIASLCFGLIAIIMSLYGRQVISLMVIILLIVLGCISKTYKHFTGISLGFELVTFAIIVFAYEMSLFFAVTVSIIMLVISEFLSTKINIYSIASQIAINLLIIIVVIITHALGLPLIPVAVGLIIIRNILLFPALVWLAGIDIFRSLLIVIPNVFINIFLVLKLLEWVISIV